MKGTKQQRLAFVFLSVLVFSFVLLFCHHYFFFGLRVLLSCPLRRRFFSAARAVCPGGSGDEAGRVRRSAGGWARVERLRLHVRRR